MGSSGAHEIPGRASGIKSRPRAQQRPEAALNPAAGTGRAKLAPRLLYSARRRVARRIPSAPASDASACMTSVLLIGYVPGLSAAVVTDPLALLACAVSLAQWLSASITTCRCVGAAALGAFSAGFTSAACWCSAEPGISHIGKSLSCAYVAVQRRVDALLRSRISRRTASFRMPGSCSRSLRKEFAIDPHSWREDLCRRACA